VDKKLIVIDPSRVPEWYEHIPYTENMDTITHFYKKYIAAMNVNSSRWDQDIYKWSFIMKSVLLKTRRKGTLRATWFCSTCLGGKVPREWRFVRMAVLFGRTSSSMCWRWN
jgi:hypothetical protein